MFLLAVLRWVTCSHDVVLSYNGIHRYDDDK